MSNTHRPKSDPTPELIDSACDKLLLQLYALAQESARKCGALAEDAADCASACFLTLFHIVVLSEKSTTQLEEQALKRRAHVACDNWIRTTRRERSRHADLREAPEHTPFGVGKPIDARIMRAELRTRLRHTLGLLSERHLELWRLRHIEELTVVQIAERLDISQAVVKKRLIGMKKELTEALAMSGITHEEAQDYIDYKKS